MRDDGAPRVALFADSFHEVNGVALTCRMLENFASVRGYPMLSVHTGAGGPESTRGSVIRSEIPMSGLSFGLEKDLRFDLAFLRHFAMVRRQMERFRPDIVHITGPSHVGILGALLAWRLKIPMVASWHTNVHEYAARRLGHLLSWLPRRVVDRLAAAAEAASLWASGRFYGLARVTLAPNPELIAMLEHRTGRPCHLMRRGVDTSLYNPDRRRRSDPAIAVGYVGRLSPEKSIRRLAAIAGGLINAGIGDFRIEIAGHGGERDWLRANVANLHDHGVLRGEQLAQAYAGFDIFAFPSETDTYGNVVQEAMASGVPCVVMNKGGPASIVTSGHDGFVCTSEASLVSAVVRLASDLALRRRLGEQARRTALDASWERVFEIVYAAYADALCARQAAAPLSS
jgi:glycosyltransferase involved in cell wall biosynthesis